MYNQVTKITIHIIKSVYISEIYTDLVRSNREDNIPTYEDLILQDLSKKVEEDEEELPPPRYEDIV